MKTIILAALVAASGCAMGPRGRRAAYVGAAGMQSLGQGLQQAGQQQGYRPPLRCTPDPLAVVPGSMTCR